MAVFKENSRYRNSFVTNIESEGEIRSYTILKRLVDIPLTEEDSYIVIDENWEFKPEMIAYAMYGTVDLGWAVLEINGLRSFLDLKRNTRLRIPPIEAILGSVPDTHNRG